MAPIVEMLWETLDAATVLRERFGCASPEAAGDWVTARLDRHWGTEASCSRIVLSSTNALAWTDGPDGPLLLKWSVEPARFERLTAVAALTDWLGERGLPVSVPLPTCDGRLQLEVDGVSIGLQRRVDGDLLDVDDVVQVRAAGVVLARLQDSLSHCPAAGALGSADAVKPLRSRITRWVETRAEHLPGAARDVLLRLLVDAPTDPLPTQLVHYDIRAANILCAGSEVVAVLDFEEARYEHRVVELARAAILLGTRFRDWGPTADIVRSVFLGGYTRIRPLTDVERSWWDVLLLWHALLMVPAGPDPTGWAYDAQRIADTVTGRL